MPVRTPVFSEGNRVPDDPDKNGGGQRVWREEALGERRFSEHPDKIIENFQTGLSALFRVKLNAIGIAAHNR